MQQASVAWNHFAGTRVQLRNPVDHEWAVQVGNEQRHNTLLKCISWYIQAPTSFSFNTSATLILLLIDTI